MTTELSRNLSILIVDNLSTMRRALKNCLKKLGFENVSEADSKEAALEMLRAQQFEFIISEWSLPELDLFTAMKKDERFKSIPLLIITAEAQKIKLVETTKVEATHYLVKPFTAELLKTKMDAVLENTPR